MKVYGTRSGLAKLAASMCSPGTPLKFEEPIRELSSLAKQVGGLYWLLVVQGGAVLG